MKSALLLFGMALVLASCGKSDDPSAESSSGGDSGSGSGSNSVDPQKPWEDNAKPYLTEKKMEDFIGSLKDPNTPFETFAKGVTAFNAESKLKEFDAAAQKHGFKDGEEYLGAWLRIVGISTEVMLDEQNEMLIKGQEESIKTSEEALKKPDLTPEMKKMFEDQIKGAKETIAAYRQPRESSFNEKDKAAFKKHRAEFDKAVAERTKSK